jgi:hypothetical protein
MSVTVKDLTIHLRSFSGHGSLFQNFSNRQTAYYIFVSEQSVMIALLKSMLDAFTFFQMCRIEFLSQPSMSATIELRFAVHKKQ